MDVYIEKRNGERKKKGEYKWRVISISAGEAIVLSDQGTTNVRLKTMMGGEEKKNTVEVKWSFFFPFLMGPRGENTVLITAICSSYLKLDVDQLECSTRQVTTV